MKKTFFLLMMIFINMMTFAQVSQNAANNDDHMISLDFRNQKISDILFALAEIAGKTIILDETISGSASFRFADTGFESALARFADFSNLFVTKTGNDYLVSKVSINVSAENKSISLEAEDVLPESIVKKLAEKTHTTILHDALPKETITIRTKNASLEEILHLVLMKNPDYAIIKQAGGFYLKRDAALTNETRAQGSFLITKTNDRYAIASKRVLFSALIDALFKEAGKEYLILKRSSAAIENIYYNDKDFTSVLRLILDTVNYDYKIENDVYYLFEIQERDIVKKLKNTVSVKLAHLSVIDIQNILPGELNASSFIKIDRAANSVIVTGSKEEINPILNFLRAIDVPLEGRYYKLFTVNNITAENAIKLLPPSFFYTDPVIIPGTQSFTAQVDAANEKNIAEYLSIIDIKNNAYPIKLRYIKSDELLRFLPPAIAKESITLTGNNSLVFYTGSEGAYQNAMKEIIMIDQIKPQIRYQLLVIQRQRSDGLNWESDFSIKKTDSKPSADYSAQLSHLVNINFDIVSSFGMQFAGNLNADISMNRAKVLADTTLNAISDEEITFENTNTYRYRDVAIDTETGLYSGATREITSGLTIKIQGWVSGDEMITVNVDANVSKQGAVTTNDDASTNPPSTSEKTVSTHVRAKSGEPIIIGGLLQSESDVIKRKVPILGEIPIIGLLFTSEQITVSETEFIIYLIPLVEKNPDAAADMEKNMRAYYQKYVNGEMLS